MAAAVKDREIVILPDNDPAGERWVREIADVCFPSAQGIRVLRLPDLPQKADVSDWLQAGGTREELLRMGREAPPYTPKSRERKTTGMTTEQGEQVNRVPRRRT